MSQQVPFDNNGVPQGNNMVAAGGYMDGGYDPQGGYAPQGGYGPQGGYMPQEMPPGSMPPNVPMGPDSYGNGGGGYWQPPQGPQTYTRNTVPMIDPIESAKLTPQIMVLLVLSGLKRHWKWSLPMGLILGLLMAGGLYLAFPLQFESRASIQIRTVKPELLGNTNRAQGGYDSFVNTQLAYMRSPAVLERALEDTEVARLPIVLKQPDKRSWLAKQLRVKTDGKSEIVGISIETDTEEASEKIVNAVVSAYFTFFEELERQTDTTLLTQLQVEKRRQLQQAQQLQDNIRKKTASVAKEGGIAGEAGMVAGLGLGESLSRDLNVAESQLVAMTAKMRAVTERIQRPAAVPIEVLIQSNPEVARLNTELRDLQQQKDEIKQYLSDANDPKIKMIDRQIANAKKLLDEITGTADDSAVSGMTQALLFQARIEQWSLDQDIKTQAILVEEIRRRYTEQLASSAVRSEETVDITFDTTQLARTNKTIDQIDDRILTIQSEARAPGRIQQLTKAVNAQPSRLKQITTVGMGAAMFTFFPLLLSIAVERMKPRLYHVSQVRRAVPQVLIGEIMEPPVSWVHGTTFRKRLARYRESVHNWCTHLLLSDPFRTCKTLSVASVAGDDGKTFLAVQIAVAMAQMKEGKVLLIDGDMRVGRLHLLFGNEETGIGLADVLSFRNRPGEAIVQNEKEPNLELLSAGQLDVTPYELLGDGRFRELLDSLAWSPSNLNGYSLIIVVLPPVANAAESLIMASSTDSTLLCVRQGETVLAAMEDVYRKLVNTGSSVDGIVVKDIPYYQMAGRDGGFADKLEQIRLSHLLQYTD